MGKRILWVSRFGPLPVQREALDGMFGGDCEVVHQDIPNSAEVAAKFVAGDYADLVCVVPLATLDHICREGLTPLWADMVETMPANRRAPDLQFSGKCFWFAGFRRVAGVALDLRPVDPVTRRRVVRFTRHPASPAERAALRAVFGDGVKFAEDSRPFRDGREIVERFRAARADDLLVVAPYSVYDQLAKSGVMPLYAEVVEGRFRALWRCHGVQIQFKDV